MTVLLSAVATVLLLFQIVLIARVVLDWSGVLAGPPSPGSFRSRLTGIVYAVTEPVLAPVRKVVPPLRIGGVALDMAFLIVLFGVYLLRTLILSL